MACPAVSPCPLQQQRTAGTAPILSPHSGHSTTTVWTLSPQALCIPCRAFRPVTLTFGEAAHRTYVGAPVICLQWACPTCRAQRARVPCPPSSACSRRVGSLLGSPRLSLAAPSAVPRLLSAPRELWWLEPNSGFAGAKGQQLPWVAAGAPGLSLPRPACGCGCGLRGGVCSLGARRPSGRPGQHPAGCSHAWTRPGVRHTSKRGPCPPPPRPQSLAMRQGTLAGQPGIGISVGWASLLGLGRLPWLQAHISPGSGGAGGPGYGHAPSELGLYCVAQL